MMNARTDLLVMPTCVAWSRHARSRNDTVLLQHVQSRPSVINVRSLSEHGLPNVSHTIKLDNTNYQTYNGNRFLFLA